MRFPKVTRGAPAAAATRVPGQKKSCNLCVLRKRKCDGVTPTCGFCLSRGSECSYSLRRPNRTRGYVRRLDGGGGQQLTAKLEEKSGSGYGSGEEESSEMQQRENAPPVGWKRVRLSASPATGLVGTKENAFLASFFKCLGFLPMTHERLVRATMIDMLLASPSGLETFGQASAKSPYTAEAHTPARACGGGEERGGPDAASECALWCTIAMGALVQGQSPQQVAPYMHLAWTSLSQCFDTVTVESGRAFLMMAYLYNFMRDDDKFYQYLQLARRVIDHVPGNTAHKQEIDDLVMMGDDTRIFHTAALEPSELDDYCTDDSPALEVTGVVHKSDLCRLLLQADRRLMKAFLRDHRAHAAFPPELRKRHASSSTGSDTGTSESGGGVSQERQWMDTISREDTFADGGEWGYLSGLSVDMDDVSIDSTKLDQESSPSRPGDETWKCTGEARKIFARLGEAADAPEVRAGVGSLLYNSILGYLDMVTGSSELEAGFEKAKHCAEIISRYPGLCRFSTWRHLTHCLLSFLSKLGDVELFEELRRAYNSVRAEGAPKVPPHADWTMVGFCDHIFCRSMDHLDKDWGGMDATGETTRGDWEEKSWLSGGPQWLKDTQENNDHWAILAPEYHDATAMPGQTFPTHKWADVPLPYPVDPSSISAQHFQYMAPAPGLSAVGPLSTACVNPVWSLPGHVQTTAPGHSANGGAFTCADGHTHNDWYP